MSDKTNATPNRPVVVSLPGKPFDFLHEYAEEMVAGFGNEAEEKAFHDALDNAKIVKCGRGTRVTLFLTMDEARAMLSEAEKEADTDLVDFEDKGEEDAHREGLEEVAKRIGKAIHAVGGTFCPIRRLA